MLISHRVGDPPGYAHLYMQGSHKVHVVAGNSMLEWVDVLASSWTSFSIENLSPHVFVDLLPPKDAPEISASSSSTKFLSLVS